jgi:hypothetical protein
LVTAFPIPPEQRVIRNYTDRAEPRIRTIFINAVKDARAEIDLDFLEALLGAGRGLSEGDFRAVVQLDTMLGRFEVDFRPLLEDVLFRSASSGELVFAEGLGLEPIDLGIFRRDAAQVARTMVGDLIQGIEIGHLNPLTGTRSRGQLGIVRDLVAEGFELGRSHFASARLIRDVIGLDDRRAGALAKYAAELEAKGIAEAKRLRLIEKESRRKLQSRSLAVSRTESVRAASLAQNMIWERAVQAGQITEEYEQEWLPALKACPRCEALRGARAPLGGRFPEPGGAGPPLHRSCAC